MIDDPRQKVISDAIGIAIIVDSIEELKDAESFIDKRFSNIIIEKDDKYRDEKYKKCVEYKDGKYVVEKCGCENSKGKGLKLRDYTAIHYSMLVTDEQSVAVIAEVQVKTKLVNRISFAMHDLYKMRSKSFDVLFSFIYYIAEMVDSGNDIDGNGKRVLRHFVRMRGGKGENIVCHSVDFYMPPEIVKYFNLHGRLPRNTPETLLTNELDMKKEYVKSGVC